MKKGSIDRKALREARELAARHKGARLVHGRKDSISLLDWCVGNWETGGERIYLAWNTERNRGLGYEIWNISSSSGQKVWFKCAKGHEWIANLAHIQYGRWCPHCSTAGTSYPEQILYLWLAENFDSEQVQNRVQIGGFEADVCVEKLKLIIEYQGSQWHRKSLKRDFQKVKVWRGLGYEVLWVMDWDCKAYGSVARIMHDCVKDKDCFGLIRELRGYLKRKFGVHGLTRLKKRQLEQAFLSSRVVAYDKSFEYHCKKEGKEGILAEWHKSKNSLSSGEVTKSTRQTVWWKCADCGTEYEAEVHQRFYEYKKCPLCHNKAKTA